MIVGLTGSSGSGKSTVAKVFQKKGFTHIDCDGISRNVTAKGSDCLREIVSNFGDGILLLDGGLDRRALGEIVFRDAEKLNLLNGITHKYILKVVEDIILSSESDVLLDAPLLFESDLDKRCDINIGVISERSTQIKRIAMRDGISEDTAAERLAKQHDNEFFIKNCNFCIENNGSEVELIKNTEAIILKIKGVN